MSSPPSRSTTISPSLTFSCGHASSTLPLPHKSPNTTPAKLSSLRISDYPFPCRTCAYTRACTDAAKVYAQYNPRIAGLEARIVAAKNEQMRKDWKDQGVVEQRVSLMRGQVADLVVVRAKVVEGGWREFERRWGEV